MKTTANKKPKFNDRIHSPILVASILQKTAKVPKPPGREYAHLETDCWLYQTTSQKHREQSNDHYAMVMFNRRRYLAHVVMLEDATGRKIPKNLIVRHRCDRPSCCNPEHLETGTHLDNARDRVLRNSAISWGMKNGMHTQPGSRPRGEKHSGASITDAVAAEIKGCLEKMGHKCNAAASIAAYFGTTVTIVRQIASQKTWQHVKAAPPKELPPLLDRGQAKLVAKSARSRWKKLTPEQVADIRYTYHEAEDPEKRHLKKNLASQYNVSLSTIDGILKRLTHKEVAPEIPPIQERGHGMSHISDREVQLIRATFKANPELQKLGLAAALGRFFNISRCHTYKILSRKSRNSTPDDDEAIVPLEKLYFKPLQPRGEKHHLAKFSEDDVRQILRWHHLEKRSFGEIFRHYHATSRDTIRAICRGKVWKIVFQAFCEKHGIPKDLARDQ